MDRTKLFLMLWLPLAASAEIHQWRDDQGRLHFGDKPPAEADTTVLQTERRDPGEALAVNLQAQEFTLSAEAERRMLQGLKQVLASYRQTLGLDVTRQVQVNLSLFDSHESFARWFRQREEDTDPAAFAGVFFPATGEVGVWNHGTEEAVVETILHEGSHVILAQLTDRAPSWLHEGMAQYFQTIRPDGERLRVPPLEPAAELIRQWLENDELITLRDYLSIPEQRWRELAHNRNAVPYTVAWALVYFLMSKPVGEQALRRLLHDLDKSGRQPTLKRLAEIYPGGISRLEYEFFKWAQGPMRPHYY